MTLRTWIFIEAYSTLGIYILMMASLIYLNCRVNKLYLSEQAYQGLNIVFVVVMVLKLLWIVLGGFIFFSLNLQTCNSVLITFGTVFFTTAFYIILVSPMKLLEKYSTDHGKGIKLKRKNVE